VHTALPTLEAIPLQMYQLFANLVSNSLKFAREDIKPVISITCSLVDGKGAVVRSADESDYAAYYRIELRDNGIGFDPTHAGQIFNIFQRLHRKSEYAGTGIGLAMCRKIAQNHHGDIFATGIPGEGAVFTVILPARQAAD
jgi:signal transduction histidine kinase